MKHRSVRVVLYLIGFALIWQLLFLSGRFDALIFPSVPSILDALVSELKDGSMFLKVGYSMYLILMGVAISLAIAVVATPLCMLSAAVKDLARMLISVMDPLPGIALLPLAILWCGIGERAILFVMIHSIVWPMLLNIIAGFDSVPQIYRDVGRGFGLNRLQMTARILAPASFPNILTGVKTGWARAWRALISAEMVFGATGERGGLGWDIYIKRSFLDMPGMFASLIVIMLIGILVENLLFRAIEKNTLQKWGMIR